MHSSPSKHQKSQYSEPLNSEIIIIGAVVHLIFFPIAIVCSTSLYMIASRYYDGTSNFGFKTFMIYYAIALPVLFTLNYILFRGRPRAFYSNWIISYIPLIILSLMYGHNFVFLVIGYMAMLAGA